MAGRYYRWRDLTDEEREHTLEERKRLRRPWHAPPHYSFDAPHNYHVSAACFEHKPHIGHSLECMDAFTRELHQALHEVTQQVFAWCILPNHYHLLVTTENIKHLTDALGQLHGRSSFQWNGFENTRGRKVFHRATDRFIRSDAHFWATMNYIHHNPVHHGYILKWNDWPWSSAHEYIMQIGCEKAERIWREFPLHDYGKGWDDASL